MTSKKKKIKILHIDSGNEWRGGQRQVLTLHKGLIDNNIQSFLLCNKKGKLFEISKKQNIPNVFSFDYKGELSISSHLSVYRIHKEIEPTIIHCHDAHTVSLSFFLRNVTKFHTRRVSYKINFLSLFLKYRTIDFHIGVSIEIMNYLKQYFQNVTSIPSCIDLKRFSKISDINVFNEKKFNILFVGAFSEQKGINILIPAFKNVLKHKKNVHLNFVGDGDLSNWAKHQIRKLGIEKNTTFFGSRQNVEIFYQNSNLVVCPSVSGEGSSGVIKEALASGKTVIASDLECNKEILDDYINGLLFKNQDVNELSEKIIQVIENKTQINAKMINHTAQKFKCENMIKSYIELYKKV